MQDTQGHPSAVLIRVILVSYADIDEDPTTPLQSFLAFPSINTSYLIIIRCSVELFLLIRNLASYGDILEDPPDPPAIISGG